VLAGVTLLAAILLAIRLYGAAAGLRMILTEAWPGLLTGFALALLTGFALRVAVPSQHFWFVLGPLYLCAVAGVIWFARREPK